MAGRPSRYKAEYAELAYKFCLLGADDNRLAEMFEVDVSTVNRWKLAHASFCESIKRGKEIADANVAQQLYHRATGYSHPEVITASYQGQITDKVEVVKHYAPDPTAAIFWLKNRQPKQWRDKQDIEHSGEVKQTVSHDLKQLSPEELKNLEQILAKTSEPG